MNIGKEQFFLTGIQNCEGEKLIFVQLCAVLSTTRCISLRRGILIDYVEPQYVVVTDVMTYYILCFTWAGVLFLDELPEYQRQTLEALRQPLEDGFVNVTRISGQARYQSRCMLVASMNPCPCGNHGSKSKPCRCKPNEIKRYLARISGPLLDRIDIQVEMDAVELEDIRGKQEQEDTVTVQKRVVAARNLQLERYRDESFFCNAQMPQEGIETYCAMEAGARAMLHSAMEKFHISMRTYSRICKVARTVADLSGHAIIQPQDIAEAIHLRNLDGRYWR